MDEKNFKRRMRPWRAAAALVGAVALWGHPVPALARNAAGFLHSIQQVLADPQVYLNSTTPFSPLVTTDNGVLAFHGGTGAATRALCDAIRAAEHEVLLQVYQWDDRDAAAKMVREAIRDRARRALDEKPLQPLVIRVVVNDTWPASSYTPNDLLRCLFEDLQAIDPRGDHVLVELARYTGFAFSVVHAKYAVIDHRQVLLRTNNLLTLDGVDRDFFNGSMHFAGPCVTTLRDDWLNLRAQSTLVDAASHTPAVWPDLVAPSPAPQASEAITQRSPMAVLAKPSRANPWTEGPSNPQSAGLLAMIDASEQEILSLNPALNVVRVQAALQRAMLNRGVQVTLILSLNMNRSVQHRLQGGDNADIVYAMLDHLLAHGGVEAAKRLHVYWASADGRVPAAEHSEGNNHAKTALYDNEALWFGSMNWDWQSWNNSRELSVVVFDAAVAPRWREEIWQPVFSRAAPLRAADLPQCLSKATLAGAVCRHLDGIFLGYR